MKRRTTKDRFRVLVVGLVWSFLGCVMQSAPAAATAELQLVQPEFHLVQEELNNACASFTDCRNCSDTYTCHWCDFDNQCHAKGSVHGCTWGSSCEAPKPKENTTCSSRHTCSECVLSSRLCHWCEHDNACHAIGSPYGCTTGVDCYSNDRCRRKDSEPIQHWAILDVPTGMMVLILSAGALLVGCLCCCHYCFFNVKGAYDDLASISMAASRPPSVIGGSFMQPSDNFYTTLETHPEEDQENVEADNDDVEANESAVDNSEAAAGTENEAQEESNNPNTQTEGPLNVSNEDVGPTTPLLPQSPRSYNGVLGLQETPHMSALYRMCACLYYIGLFLVLTIVFTALFFYPKPPVYNVCNDAVAWKNIIEAMVALKLHASFEILISVSNPNHLTVVVDKASGSFTFDGRPIGTYELPPATAEGMSITDMMLISSVTPDKHQALQLAEAYYKGKLVLNANFKGRFRVPALFDATYDLHLEDIDIYVNELGPRDLCHCPSWDEARIKPTLAFFNESIYFNHSNY